MANRGLDIHAFIDQDATAGDTEIFDIELEEIPRGNGHGIEGLEQEQKTSEKILYSSEAAMRNHELNKGRMMKGPMQTIEEERGGIKGPENQDPGKTTTREIEEMFQEKRLSSSMKDEFSSYNQGEELGDRIRLSSGFGFGTGEESRVNKATDNGAFMIGNELSRFLSDFLNLFSVCGEVMEMIQELRSSIIIKSVTEDMNTITVNRIFTLLELAEEEVGNARAMTFISHGKRKDDDVMEKILEDFHQRIINQGSPPESKALRREKTPYDSDLIKELQKCKQLLAVVEKKTREMKLNYGRIFGYIRVYEILQGLKNSEIKGM